MEKSSTTSTAWRASIGTSCRAITEALETRVGIDSLGGLYVESIDVAGSCRNTSIWRLRVRSTLSMDAGTTVEIHGQKSLRPVPRRTTEGARRDAETAEGAHRRRGAGGVAQPGV